VDGPEFDGHKVDYDELMLRLQAYLEDEKKVSRGVLHPAGCQLEVCPK